MSRWREDVAIVRGEGAIMVSGGVSRYGMDDESWLGWWCSRWMRVYLVNSARRSIALLKTQFDHGFGRFSSQCQTGSWKLTCLLLGYQPSQHKQKAMTRGCLLSREGTVGAIFDP